MLSPFAFILFLIFSYPINAWGCQAHRLTVELAKHQMDTHELEQLQELISRSELVKSHLWKYNNIEDCVCIPDRIKKEKEYKHTYSWHFYDIEYNITDKVTMPNYAFESVEPNIYNSLIYLINKFQYYDDELERSDSLVFILHLLGDMTQPYHVTQLISDEYPKGDRGGLKYSLYTGGYKNLHMLTDNVANVYSKQDFKNLPKTADKLHQYCLRNKLYGTDLNNENWVELIQNWITETHLQGIEIYELLNGSHKPTSRQLDRIKNILVHSLCRSGEAISTIMHLILTSDAMDEL